MSGHDKIRQALQALLDQEGDGWHIRDWCVVMGLERIDAAGRVDTTAWMTAPTDQPDWVTDGLIAAGEDMRANAEIDDD